MHLSKLKIELPISYKGIFRQLNYVCDFFDRNGNLKSWVNLVYECKILKKNVYTLNGFR